MNEEAPDLHAGRRVKADLLADATTVVPTDRKAELGVLGCILMGDLDTAGDAAEALRPDDFFFEDTRHGIEVALAMLGTGERINSVTFFAAWNRQNGKLPASADILCAPNSIPSAGMLPHYIAAVIESSQRRTTQALGKRLAYMSCDPGVTVDEMTAELESCTARVQGSSHACYSALDCARMLAEDLEKRFTNRGAPNGVVTGIPKLDEMTNGLQLGEQFVIAARPSQGKTTMGVNFMEKAGYVDRVPCLFISCEMSITALQRRLAASACRIDSDVLRKGAMTQEQLVMIRDFNLACSKAPMFWVDGVSGMSALQAATIIRRHVRKHGVKLVVIDYLQKLQAVRRHEKRTYEVAEASGILKAVAMQTGVALVTLAQLNRESEKEKGRSPRLSDLADSGQIERDADMVGMLHCPKDGAEHQTNLIIGKNRDGATGVICLYFHKQFCHFKPLER